MKFSVVFNTYNADKHLRKILEAVKDVDEVVICDMHSTDNTIAIANEFNCKIVYYHESGKNVGICEPARNLAIQSAGNDWVLLLDADEIVTKDLLLYCNAHIQLKDPAVGVFIPRKNYLHGTFMHASYPDHIMRFFKKDCCFWPPHIHSVPKIEGVTIKIPAKNKNLAIIHLDDEDVYKRIEKMNTYTNYHVKHLENSGRKFSYLAMPVRILFFFFKYYLIKGGFRDGKMGLVYALLHSFYRYTTMAKLWESQLHEDHNS